MVNVHMKSAATSIRQAVTDIQLKLQEMRMETNSKVREIEKRLNEIRAQESVQANMMAQTKSDAERARYSNTIQQLNKEVSDLQNQIYHMNDEYRKVQSDLDRQIVEFQGLANRLDATA